MYKLDDTDRAIVNLLMEDGRMPCSQIARRIGRVSERAVRYRIDQLVAHGVVRISAIPNPQSLGFSVIADVVIEVEPGRILDVAHKLSEYERITYVACSTGDRDISIQVVARDNAELYQFVAGVLGNVPGVRKTTTMVVPFILKDVYEWHIPALDSGK